MIRRSFKFRLAPTPEQEEKLWQFAGVTRFVYNLALEQRRNFWRQYEAATGGGLNFASQGRQVTELRREVDWIRATPVTCLTQALRDLDKAFANFFAGRARFPRPRKKGFNDAFRIQWKESHTKPINRRWARVHVPNLGLIAYRRTREILGRIVNLTILHSGDAWFVSFACEIEHDPPVTSLPAVGIDRGIAIPLALSTGETIPNPDLTVLDRHLRRARRVLSRRMIGSKRRAKARRRVCRVAARVARVRRDWQHRASTNIARRFGTVAIEDLKIENMTASGPGKRGLNRSILNQGWGGFAAMLSYKLEERGGTLVKVNPAFTSQTCSTCGTVDRRSRESQASFVCTTCGFRANADTNAAINILRRSTALMPVEGCGYAPDEAGTGRMAA